MLSMFLWLALSSPAGGATPAEGIIPAALNNYRDVAAYTVTLDSRSSGRHEVIKYFYKRPGYVRMNFVEPHRGAALVYDPVKKQARLRPLFALESFVVTLRPDNSLITSSKGHTIAESDIGALLKNVETLQNHGSIEALSEEKTGGRDAVKVKILGASGFAAAGTNAYVLWLEKKSLLPLRVMAYDAKGNLTEDVLMDDLEVNPALPDDLFKLE